jgi:hypothetical protein
MNSPIPFTKMVSATKINKILIIVKLNDREMDIFRPIYSIKMIMMTRPTEVPIRNISCMLVTSLIF